MSDETYKAVQETAQGKGLGKDVGLPEVYPQFDQKAPVHGWHHGVVCVTSKKEGKTFISPYH